MSRPTKPQVFETLLWILVVLLVVCGSSLFETAWSGLGDALRPPDANLASPGPNAGPVSDQIRSGAEAGAVLGAIVGLFLTGVSRRRSSRA
ncbi:MAG: hypothetical protein HY720_26785 [Planctomycetes bacterium]|nr:hypothetical protein [Planctomycetota bacterium]